MSFKTAFHYQREIYQIEFIPKALGKRMIYFVVIGSELSAQRRTIQIVPNDIPGSSKVLSVLNRNEFGEKAMSREFIQAVGEAIQKYEE